MTLPERPADLNEVDELAALYALDLLEDADQAKVDRAFAQDAGFVEQVQAFQETTTAIAYSAPPVPIAADLKTRLLARIAQASDTAESPLLKLLRHSVEDLKQQAAELTWKPMMATYAAEVAVWQTDEVRREVAFFVRKSRGGLFPKHAHAGGETVLVLEGDFVANGQVHGVGDRAESIANTAHQPGTQAGCLLFCIASMDDEMLS